MKSRKIFSHALAMLIVTGCDDSGGAPSTTGGETPPPNSPRATLIADENARPGDSAWKLFAPSGRELGGYGSRITARAGDRIDVAVHVDTPRPVRWTLYRIGWYGGAGARRVSDGGPVQVSPQPACPRDPTTSLIECSWATAFTVEVPADALSGVYLIKLLTDQPRDSYVPFIVHDGRPADILLDVNVTTWAAYNAFGGESLYSDDSGTMPDGKAFQVSFDRPFVESKGAGRFLYWEVFLVQWLEALGYDVSYTTVIDLGHEPDAARRVRLFLSAANDEYWTVAAREAVDKARDAGVNLAWLGADQVLWRVRLQPSSRGVPDRIVAGYKAMQDRDPLLATLGDAGSTAMFRDPPNARPENALIGVMYIGWMVLPQPIVVVDPSHWVFAGTGLGAGDSIPMMVGAEADTRFANGAEPAGLRELAVSPIVDGHGLPQRAMMTWYRAASGAEVVAAGSIGWPSGLGQRGIVHPLAGRITRNIVDHMVGAGHAGDPDPADAPWVQQPLADQVEGAWAPSVETVAGRPDIAAAPADGPGQGARFRAPTGVAVGPDGAVFVADARAQQIRRIAPDASHTVTTWAGSGIDGSIDGPGAIARFRWPTGIAVDASGNVWVADAENNRIRRIAADAAHTVSTWAGAVGGGFADGDRSIARFNEPTALAVAPDGSVFVSDMHNHRIRHLETGPGGNVSTWAGGTGVGLRDGPGASALFNNPAAITVASDGVVYVMDTYARAVRRIANDPAHTVTTIVSGDVTPSRLIDGSGTVANIAGQSGLAWLGGRLFVSDLSHVRIRVIDPGTDAASTYVRTLAGDGRTGWRDGAGQEASFAAPMGVAAAADGSIYVADSGTQSIRRIR